MLTVSPSSFSPPEGIFAFATREFSENRPAPEDVVSVPLRGFLLLLPN